MPEASRQATHPGAPILSAAAMIGWRRQRGERFPAMPGAAILTHQRLLLPHHRWRRGLNPDRLGSFEVRRPRNPKRDAGLALCGLGAPATAVAIEELACLGVRRIVTVDLGGSLEPSLPSGSLVLVESAIATDGTSKHYLDGCVARPSPDLTARLSATLTAAGLEHRTGIAWSTDAVYRETPELVARHREMGASIVDMETAAIFAVCAALGVEAAALLVAADQLHNGWAPPGDLLAIQALLRRLVPVVAGCLRE